MSISRRGTRRFVSLHSHSTFSFGDGFGTVQNHVDRIAELGGSALALTEHGNVSSWVQLEKAAKAKGIKPLFGLEAYTAPPKEQRKFHMIILAESLTGLRNLNNLVGLSYAEGFYRWPTIHGTMLRDHSEGLIVTSGCADSLLSCTLAGGKSLGDRRSSISSWDLDAAERVVRRFQDLLGDGYYLEVQRFPGLDRTRLLNPALAELSRRTGVPLVATADVHYPYARQNEMQKILHAAHRGGTVESAEAGWEYDILLTYPTSDAEVYQDLINTGLTPSQAWQAVLATEEIAERCSVQLPKNEVLRFPVPDGYTAHEYLWEILREGWRYRIEVNPRLRGNPNEYADRLHYEMALIEEKDFSDYFLMVSDAVRFAKDLKPRPIPVGPARGSAAASLVCYLARITEVDPLSFPAMVFERFIDRSRLDLPDIDLDFADTRREEVHQYLVRRYGDDRVASIGNFVKYRGRNSVVDVARVYKIPKRAEDAVKAVVLDRSGGDSRADDSLADSIAMFPGAQAAVAEFPALWRAVELEGNMRSLSIHAAGIVISNRPIRETCAVYTRELHGQPRSVLAYDKKDAEAVGMLKMDFLGLSTMGMIDIVLEMVGMKLAELYNVPLDEPRTLDAFRRGDVVGIFQFEGRATRLVNAGVVPDHFMHLADINALARPGPLFSGMTAQYIDIKHGRKKPDHLHPLVWKYTEFTYGQIIYQEQVLSIVREMGGFPVERIGDIRRAISQKLGEAHMNNMRELFISGAQRLHGVDEKLADRIWKFMVTSATYSFCCTGDTVVEKGGAGRFEASPRTTIAELYAAQQSKSPIGDKMRYGGGIKLLSMDDDGRIRPNRLIKIHAPVPYHCYKITTKAGRSLTCSADHRLLTMDGYAHVMELQVGDTVIVDAGWAAREAERTAPKGPNNHAKGGIWAGMIGAGTPGFLDGRHVYLMAAQRAAAKRSGGHCEHCGAEGDGSSHALEFAHILTFTDHNGNWEKYNSVDNILHLCNSCHKKFDYQVQGTRLKRWSRGRPTTTDVITSIEEAGQQDVYEISMEGPSHNYVSNDFVSHNNVAHCISYSQLGFWCQYLKQYYPREFYAAQLQKVGDTKKAREGRRPRLLVDAVKNGYKILPPDPIESGLTWAPVKDGIQAGLLQIPKVGGASARAMLAYREQFGVEEWQDFAAVRGIGPTTIENMENFADADDPFDIELTARVLDEIRTGINKGWKDYAGFPHPTHRSHEIPRDRDCRVVWIGIVRKIEYKDLIEDERARSGDSVEDIVKRTKDPKLVKSVTLHCSDDGDDDVYLRINRWRFPDFRERVEQILPGETVVICTGLKKASFGVSLQVERLIVLAQEEEDDEDEELE
jgi:DNA polymerase-3 subunit alpha